MPKRPKILPEVPFKHQAELAHISMPSQTTTFNKKSVKTINSESCIRQFSRPIVPPRSNPSQVHSKTVKTLPPLLPSTVSKSNDKLSKSSKSKSKAASKSTGRVFSSRSLGLVDFDKIRTTARTRNMVSGSKSLPDLTSIGVSDKKPIKSKPVKRTLLKTEDNNSVGAKSPNMVSERVALPDQASDGPSASGIKSCTTAQKSAEGSPSKASQNGINKEVKSYLILKVMPIVSFILLNVCMMHYFYFS